MFEASRLVAIQKLLHGLKMDPMVSLYWFAPVRGHSSRPASYSEQYSKQVCAVLNACLIPIYEGWAPFELVLERLGIFVLLTNASCALCLNIAVVFLIGCASSLVLTLSGSVSLS